MAFRFGAALALAALLACEGSTSGIFGGAGGDGGTLAGTSVLCRPCERDPDCGEGNLCLQHPRSGEVFCGERCSADGACPAGAVCTEVAGHDDQCAPEAGTCAGWAAPAR